MPPIPTARSRHPVLLWCLAFCGAMGVAGLIVHKFDLGWAGTLAIMLTATGMTIPIVRAAERSARFEGNLSPAMRRYNRRMVAGSLLYTLGLFLAVYANCVRYLSNPGSTPARVHACMQARMRACESFV